MNRFRYPLTLLICLASLLVGTATPSQAGHKHTLIFKAKNRFIRKSENQKNHVSNGKNDSQDSPSNGDQKKEALKLKKEHLQVEILTNGKWIQLNPSASLIETINQPLRISYHHFQQTPDKLELKLELKRHEDQFFIEKAEVKRNSQEKSLIPLVPVKEPTHPKGYIAQDQLSAIFPRLNPGIYSLTVSKVGDVSGDKPIPTWLIVTDAPLQPPVISSVDQRLAQKGILSLKIKNVVVCDELSFFVDGDFFGSGKIVNESQLSLPVSSPKMLPPGTSIITAQLKREGMPSSYSVPISITSRATKLITRKIDIKKTEFLNTSANKANEDRLQTETEFESVIDQTPDESFHQNNQGVQLTSTPAQGTEIVFVDDKIQTQIDQIKKCIRFQKSGWDVEPIFVWPTKEILEKSYVPFETKEGKGEKDLQKLPVPALKFLEKVETIIISNEVSKKILEALDPKKAITLDITFRSSPTTTFRSIVTSPENSSGCEFILGENSDKLTFYFRENNKNDKVAKFKVYKLDIVKSKTNNVVISYADHKLRFWVNNKEQKLEEIPSGDQTDKEKKVTSQTLTKGARLVLGNYPTQQNKPWKGIIHSLSIRNVAVTSRKPDLECLNFIISTSLSNLQPSADRSSDEVVKSSGSDSTPDEPVPSAKNKTDTPPTAAANDKITLQEYAFPYPAAFPISRFSRSGDRIKTEGAVLDQMRLAIAKDGRYQLDFDARTTVRAEIKLQLFIKMKDGEWYPITLPAKTILPANYTRQRFGAESGSATSFVSITGYAPILVNQQNQISDIRRRGSATFGSRPVDSSY